MERRVLLAISLSFLVLFLYQTFLVPPTRLPTAPVNATAGQSPVAGIPSTAIAPGAAAANTTPIAAGAVPSIGDPVTPTPVATLVGDTQERQLLVETQKVRAVFTNRGGRLRSWQLKDYKNEAGQFLELIPRDVPPHLPLPFSLRVDDAVVTARLNDALYKVSGVAGDMTDATGQGATLVFEIELQDGLRARKTFSLGADTYDINFSAQVQQGAETLNPTIDWGPAVSDEIARTAPGSFLSPAYLYKAQAIYSTDGDVERIAGASLAPGHTQEGQFKWAGVDDHYFIAAVIDPKTAVRMEYAAVSLPSGSTPVQVGDYVAYAVRFPSPPENVRFFFGPKQLDALRDVDPDFTKAIYFGLFAPLAAPLLLALKWLQGYIGNWGWSIIALTILINLAMFPLRHKSVVAMRKMQELQPQMKAIQERYAKYKITDPERQKMNTEVMDLYRTRGVNPASGCVPMLLTMPFLFAFYAMLGQAIEIRGADFLGYIKDLSRADPLFITPALMGATMFWQQKITPSTADPTQQKVMMFMPLMFTAMMLWAPSGLVIYWTMSQVFAIGQQYLTNYLIGPPKVINVRPPAERRVKKDA